ncbi:MAG: beta-1,6-glucan synthase [Methylophilus sp.]|nr:beta-1,6-glucan synthase [Methylophilus sp.]
MLLNSWKRYAVFYSVVLALFAFWFYQKNQPVDIVSPQLGDAQKLQCVSYAPYYGKGQSPFVDGMHISPAQIDSDLKKLSALTNCVRTYSVGQGLDYVPEAAAKLGLKVLVGAWVGWTEADNQKEILLATQKANDYPDTVSAVIIGNEVLLRGEQTEQKMRAYLQLAKRQTHKPITYADVWEFWLSHHALEQEVDFVTVHILPYWENDPVAVEVGVKHTADVMAKLQKTFHRPILIGETGWPSAGRARNHSVPSQVNQARYIREFLQKAHEQKWQYNVIEAVDQPWKRQSEGTVGGYWGILSADLVPKFSLTGAVSERHDGVLPWLLTLMGAIVFSGVGLVKRQRSNSEIIGLGVLGAIFALSVYLQIAYLVTSCRDMSEWFTLGVVAVLGWLIVLAEPYHVTFQQKNWLSISRLALFCLLLAAIVTGWFLLKDGRYRNYPVVLFALPMLVIAMGGPHWIEAKNRLQGFSKWALRSVSVAAFILAALCVKNEPQTETVFLWLFVVGLATYSVWFAQSRTIKN